MKRTLFPILVFLIVGGLGYGAYFLYQNFRGIKPAVTSAPQDIVKVIEEQQNLPPGENLTDFPLQLPAGFQISIFAKNLSGARVMAFDARGNLWVSRKEAGAITFLDIENGKVVSQHDVFDNLNNPHGLAFDPQNPNRLYIAEEDKISFADVYGNGTISLSGEASGSPDYDAVQFAILSSSIGYPQKILDLPTGGRHVTRTLHFTSQGTLLVSIGSSCDVCVEKNSQRGTVMKVNLEKRVLEPYAKGLRNAVFLANSPFNNQTWATEMGRDMLGDDLPPDEINILEEGKDYGWPYCYGNKVVDTKFENNYETREHCAQSVPALVDLPAHSAPLGLSFIPKDGWPSEYQGDLLVAYHGSWNRSDPTGYKISRLKLDETGKFGGEEDFIFGWLTKDNKALGRPVDIVARPGGELFISDDKAGVVYRVVYGSQKNVPENSLVQDAVSFITITKPSESDFVSSPLVVEGEAWGSWFFEGSFPVKLMDAKQEKILGTGVAKTQADWMTDDFVPFRALIEFSTPLENTGWLILQKANPSGLMENAAEFHFGVKFKTNTGETTNSAGCVVTGCSNQVCSHEEVITECSYKEEYICYQKARCEKQMNGSCGWTETEELQGCLSQYE